MNRCRDVGHHVYFSVGRISCAALLLGCVSCHDTEPAPQDAAFAERAASAPGVPPTEPPAPEAAEGALHREALPRSVAGVSLGMSVPAAESALGHLTCHDNKAGYRVCTGDKEAGGDIRHLELYINHGQVISVSFEGPVPANAWDVLNRLIARYGSPSLNGVRERDKTGKLHEIYGWKDDQSLYSVRFMWRDTESERPELVGTVTALWDRKGYQQWEAETQHKAPLTPGDQPREAT